MENLNHFVSSRGIIKSCSNHNIIPVSGSLTIDQDLLQKENPPKTVYICTEALLNFSVNFLNTFSTHSAQNYYRSIFSRTLFVFNDLLNLNLLVLLDVAEN